MNTPNKITMARIAVTPVLPWLILLDGVGERVVAFVVFVLAAVSDVVDGRMARGNDEITRFGQLLDPIADKLLVLVTLLPLYGLGLLPLWVVVVVLAREVIITVFRGFALGHGQAIGASGLGKAKALVQNWFVGSILVWRINDAVEVWRGLDGGAWAHWQGYTQAVIGVGLWFTVVLTLVSLLDYLRRHRGLWASAAA